MWHVDVISFLRWLLKKFNIGPKHKLNWNWWFGTEHSFTSSIDGYSMNRIISLHTSSNLYIIFIYFHTLFKKITFSHAFNLNSLSITFAIALDLFLYKHIYSLRYILYIFFFHSLYTLFTQSLSRIELTLNWFYTTTSPKSLEVN